MSILRQRNKGTWTGRVCCAVLAAVLGWPAAAPAIDVLQDRLRFTGFMLPDVEFEVQAKTLGLFTRIHNTLLVPAGSGPFPAVVLVHPCGGIGPPLRRWAEFLLAQGFAVYPMDSFGPRGVQRCGGPASAMRGARDALNLLPKLRKHPMIDAQRIALAGFSWGGEVASLVGSPAVMQYLKADDRYDASVAMYSSCIVPPRKDPQGNPLEEIHLLREDVDRPYLLLGTRVDPETPTGLCVQYMDGLKEKGLPVTHHLYDGVNHAWDAPEYREGTARDGKPFPYLYSSTVTEDSRQRTLLFLRNNLKAKP